MSTSSVSKTETGVTGHKKKKQKEDGGHIKKRRKSKVKKVRRNSQLNGSEDEGEDGYDMDHDGDGEEDDVFDPDGVLKKGKFARMVKVITHIRPLLKKDVVDADGVIHQPAPVVNGMAKFGLGKMGVHRAVVKFIGPPRRNPMAICFHFPNASLSHRQVLDAAKRKLQFVKDGCVENIQFVDRNVRHGTQGLEVRWIITCNMSAARDELLRTGIHLFNRRVATRRFDDVQSDEYREYRNYVGVQKRLFSRISDINMANKLPSALALSIGQNLPTRETTPMEGHIKHRIARQLDNLSLDQMKRKLADIEKQHSKFFDQMATLRNASIPNVGILHDPSGLPAPSTVVEDHQADDVPDTNRKKTDEVEHTRKTIETVDLETERSSVVEDADT